MRHFGIDRAIDSAGYPGSATLPPLQSVLAFLALKCSSIRRYAADDLWCMDRGPGLFAGLNVLPKTAWLSSYSDRVTRPIVDFQIVRGGFFKLFGRREAGFFRLRGFCWKDYCKKEEGAWGGCCLSD